MGQWLYRKNNNEVPTCWSAELVENASKIKVSYGIVGKTIRTDIYRVTQKDPAAELKSRFNDKRKTGYVTMEDIKDDGSIILPPVEDVEDTNLSSSSPILWDKVSVMLGQYKINGLRCFISAEYNSGDMFKPVRLRFQSREGIYWNTLSNLEEYLLTYLDKRLIQYMLDENWVLDGEVYLPGYTVNQINHFVKDANCIENKALQFWCYDVAIQDMRQELRYNLLENLLSNKITRFATLDAHLNNKERLIVLPIHSITNDCAARKVRDLYIGLGFEGLILRNPDADYQYGRRRVGYMEKFKSATDGKFLILDIYKEPKRELPIILCQNDVNTAKFETRLSATHEYQQMILRDKHLYIGKYLFVEFGERSGVEKVPMHVKKVEIKI